MFDRGEKELQRRVLIVLVICTVGGVQQTCVDAIKVGDRSLSLIVAYSKCEKSAKPAPLPAHSANCG